MLNPLSVIQSVAAFALASFIGVFIAQILMSYRSTHKALFFVKPLINGSNLPDQLSLPAAIGIIDARAEHSIISSLFRRHVISEAEVLVYNLVTDPLGFIYTLRYLIPRTIAPLGLVVGSTCIALHFIRSVMAFLIGFICGKLLLKPKEVTSEVGVPSVGNRDSVSRDGIVRASKEALLMTIYFLKRYAVVLAVLFFLDYLHVFDYMAIAIKQLTSPIPLTPQAFSILIAHTVSPTYGYIVAGEMIRQGAVAVKEALIALTLGSFLFLLFNDITRHSFPFYATLYPARTALKLSLLLILTSAISLPVQLVVVNFIS